MFLGSGTPVMDKVVFWSVQKTGFFLFNEYKDCLRVSLRGWKTLLWWLDSFYIYICQLYFALVPFGIIDATSFTIRQLRIRRERIYRNTSTAESGNNVCRNSELDTRVKS